MGDAETVPGTIEILCACESAEVTIEGKLNVIGVFSSLKFSSFPMVVPALTLAIRVRFEASDEGRHIFSLGAYDLDDQRVGSATEIPLEVKTREDEIHAWQSGTIRILNIRFAAPGDYRFDAAIDGKTIGSTWLYVSEARRRA